MTSLHTFDDLAASIEAELVDILAHRDMPLYGMMSYHLGWEGQPDHIATTAGERVHGVACLLACAAVGGDLQVAVPAAAAVEMVRSFTEIHDDVQDGNPKRDHRDAVWWVWGPAQAINAGDGMHALARLALFRLLERGVSAATTFKATQLLDQASLEMFEGRFQDLEAQERIDTTVDGYFMMASGKTGALMAGAMKLGALIGAEGEAALSALGECGANIGVGMQIRSDLGALWGDSLGDGPASIEVLNKKKLLPIVYALEKASITEKRRMGDIFFKRVLDAEDVPVVREIVEGLGAREHCEGLVGQYHRDAVEALAAPGLSAEGVEAIGNFAGALLAPETSGR